jgi:hypothetical protein
MYSCTLSLNSAQDEGLVNATPQPLYPREGPGVKLYRRLRGLQGQSGHVRKISPPTGIRSPDRPSSSEKLHRLSRPCPQYSYIWKQMCMKQHAVIFSCNSSWSVLLQRSYNYLHRVRGSQEIELLSRWLCVLSSWFYSPLIRLWDPL